MIPWRRSDEHGYSSIIVAVLLVLVLAGASYAAYRIHGNSIGAGSTGKSGRQCSSKLNVYLCVSYSSDIITKDKPAKLSVTLDNRGSKPYAWSGSSSCGNTPGYTIDGKGATRICTTDLVPFQLVSGAAEHQSRKLTAGELESGYNTLQVDWAGLETPIMTFNLAK